MKEFAAVYQDSISPTLKRHGLAESLVPDRATEDYVFSRLFAFKTPKEMSDRMDTPWKDPAFRKILQNLGTRFGTTRSDSLIRSSWRFYSTPAGPGKVAPVGSGKVVPVGSGKVVPAGRGKGVWRVLDMTDGLAGVRVSVRMPVTTGGSGSVPLSSFKLLIPLNRS